MEMTAVEVRSMDYEKLLAESPVLVTWLAGQGLNLLVALLIVIAGWTLARWASNAIQRTLERTARADRTLIPVVATLIRYIILIATLIAVLDRFGVQTASLLAVLGAAGLAVGLALQGTLSNVAAGIMLLALRPFRVGDAVEAAGIGGTVREIGLFATVIVSADGIWRQVPNSTVWSGTITNFSREPNRRLDITIGIDYDDDADRAIAIIREVVAAEPRILREPEPVVVVATLGASSVDLLVRAWTTRENFWATTWDLQKTLKATLASEGITIPYPQTVLSLRDGSVLPVAAPR
ncbi:mechanosensitive ion channel protein MscS [Zavarzinia aquatilis]|uniref:Small-conductance mechanosensitive channel n=2 Tax=Zavarzinia aquatilis TaxID=2211142 RepID=A0A317EGI3_9PROT|nr:mechanosensitive ion channel protein MscS [Zavarzinia aquatilis]